jgi:hypothetical protein
MRFNFTLRQIPEFALRAPPGEAALCLRKYHKDFPPCPKPC